MPTPRDASPPAETPQPKQIPQPPHKILPFGGQAHKYLKLMEPFTFKPQWVVKQRNSIYHYKHRK